MSEIEMKTKAQVTPKLLAELFWNMSDMEQAEFFEELHDLTEEQSTYGLGEAQWYCMSQHINKSPKAKAQACSMMVWIFNYATNFLDRRPA